MHLEVEPETTQLIEERVDSLEPDQKVAFKQYMTLAHCLHMYKTELQIMMHMLEKSLDDLLNDNSLNRIFHAMHDSGNFNEESITQLISMIFSHYSKILSLDSFTGSLV